MDLKGFFENVETARKLEGFILRFYPLVPLLTASFAVWHYFDEDGWKSGWQPIAVVATPLLIVVWLLVWARWREWWAQDHFPLDRCVALYHVAPRTLVRQSDGQIHCIIQLAAWNCSPTPIRVHPSDPDSDLQVRIDGRVASARTLAPSGPFELLPGKVAFVTVECFSPDEDSSRSCAQVYTTGGIVVTRKDIRARADVLGSTDDRLSGEPAVLAQVEMRAS
jgi:hypothetical protein